MSDTNNEIIVADTTKTDSDAWRVWNIACRWIGVVSPQSQPAFLYVCRGNQILKLVKGEYARDEDSSGAFTQCLSTMRRLWSALTRLTTASSLSSRRFYPFDTFGDFELHVNYRDYRQAKCGLSARRQYRKRLACVGTVWGNLNTSSHHTCLYLWTAGDTCLSALSRL